MRLQLNLGLRSLVSFKTISAGYRRSHGPAAIARVELLGVYLSAAVRTKTAPDKAYRRALCKAMR